MAEIYWSALPLEDESIRMARYTDPDYDDALRKDLTKKFVERLKITAATQQNIIISCFGAQGYGKSFGVLFILENYLKYLGKEIKLENIHFTMFEFLKAVERASIGDVLILDEQQFTAGTGSVVEKRILANIEMTVRAHKLSMFFLAPRFIPHNFHYFLEVWQKGSDRPWNFKKSMEEQWKYTKFIVYDHREMRLGYIVTGTPKNKKLLEQYEAKKDKFIEGVRKRRGSGRHNIIKDRAEELIKDKAFCRDFREARTKRLKQLVLVFKLEGELMSTEEQKLLLDYTELLLSRSSR